MEWILIFPVLLPVCTGLFLPLLRHKVREIFAVMGLVLTFFTSLIILYLGNLRLQFEWIELQFLTIPYDFFSFHFSSLILVACSFFGLMTTLYSLKQMKGNPGLRSYYVYLLWTVGFANGAVLSNSLILLLFFWGMTAILLYLLIRIGGPGSEKASRKSLIIMATADFFMLLGVIFIWEISGTLTMSDIAIPIKGGLTTVAFMLLMVGGLAKVGAVPFHGWIPDAGTSAPVPVVAFLPASLDKLLGIYILARISMNLFQLTDAMYFLFLMVGACTIVFSVMMGLIQEDGKKLLGYLVISGAGYMILGLGTGNPTGIAGGLFYMMNSVIWTSCLVLGMGCVEHRTGNTHLDALGGLARTMPLTFVTTLVAVLAISGIPPLSGFVSKWMIYQGLIELGKTGHLWWIFWLLAAMFGSAVTLAVGIKMIHSVFWGLPSEKLKMKSPLEAESLMTIPLLILAFFCVFFGVFAQLPLKYGIGPLLELSFGGWGDSIQLSGIWNPTLATYLLLFSLLCGFLMMGLGKIGHIKEGSIFTGGEPIDEEEIRISGTQFFGTFQSIRFIGILIEKSKSGIFDFYEGARKSVTFISSVFYYGIDRVIDKCYEWIRIFIMELTEHLKRTHTGILTTYVYWILIGMTVLFLLLMK